MDDSNAFLNESHTLAHHNLDGRFMTIVLSFDEDNFYQSDILDQVETCSQIPPVETCEQINKDFNGMAYT